MKFEEALEKMRTGRRMRHNEKVYFITCDGALVYNNKENLSTMKATLDSDDIIGEDWLEDFDFDLTFLEAMAEMMSGKKVTNRAIEFKFGNDSYYMAAERQVLFFDRNHPKGKAEGFALDEVNCKWRVV